MAKKIMISVDEDVLNRFDEHIGIIKRSTAISELMRIEIERGML